MDRPKRRARPLLPLAGALALAAGACACPDVPELQRLVGVDLATPENAVLYFQEAVRQDSPWHEYLVISEAAKDLVRRERRGELTMHNYSIVRSDVLESVEAKYGPIEDIEVLGARPDPSRPDDPTRAVVEVASGDRRTVVEMVQETSYTVSWKDPAIVAVHAVLREKDRAVELAGDQLALRLALDARPGATADDVYRVTFERAWKILRLPESEVLRDLGGAVEKAERQLKEAPDS